MSTSGLGDDRPALMSSAPPAPGEVVRPTPRPSPPPPAMSATAPTPPPQGLAAGNAGGYRDASGVGAVADNAGATRSRRPTAMRRSVVVLDAPTNVVQVKSRGDRASEDAATAVATVETNVARDHDSPLLTDGDFFMSRRGTSERPSPLDMLFIDNEAAAARAATASNVDGAFPAAGAGESESPGDNAAKSPAKEAPPFTPTGGALHVDSESIPSDDEGDENEVDPESSAGGDAHLKSSARSATNSPRSVTRALIFVMARTPYALLAYEGELSDERETLDRQGAPCRTGIRHGRGVQRYANGDVYDGEWRGNERHGSGTYTWARNRAVYRGNFHSNERHGVGHYVLRGKPRLVPPGIIGVPLLAASPAAPAASAVAGDAANTDRLSVHSGGPTAPGSPARDSMHPSKLADSFGLPATENAKATAVTPPPQQSMHEEVSSAAPAASERGALFDRSLALAAFDPTHRADVNTPRDPLDTTATAVAVEGGVGMSDSGSLGASLSGHGLDKNIIVDISGDWARDMPCGDVTITSALGCYVGDVVDGVPHGRGVMEYATGDHYDGAWRAGCQNGEGSLRFANGEVRKGKFVNNVFHWPKDLPQVIADALAGFKNSLADSAAAATKAATRRRNRRRTRRNVTADEAFAIHEATDDEDMTSQVRQANPRTDARGNPLPHEMTAFELAGNYFGDVGEDVFFAKVVPMDVSTHPDTALRQVGLIRQTGTYGLAMRPVFFDDQSQCWRLLKTREKLAAVDGDISDRVDTVPAGIVSIVGTLSLETFETEEERDAKRKAREQSEAELRAFRNVGRRGPRGGGGTGGGGRKGGGGATPSNSPSAPPPGGSSTPSNRGAAGGLRRRGSILSNSINAGHARMSFSAASGSPGTNSGSPAHGGGRKPADGQRVSRTERLGYFDGYDVRAVDHDDDDLEAIVEIGDPAREFLSKGEQLKFIRHYLTRGLIDAAADSGASMVTTGTDDISRLLALGYEALLDRVGSKPLRAEGVAVRLVGINPRAQEPHLHLGFSQHILLETGGGHAVQLDKRSGVAHCTMCKADVSDHLNSFCTKHPDYEREHVNRGPDAVTDRPFPEEMIHFQQAFLETLNVGFQIRGGRTTPPVRSATPVCLVLIGGNLMTKESVFLAVTKGWSVVVVEGSGGFADVLSTITNKVNKLNPDAGPDEFRRLIGVVDAKTSEILINGKLTFAKPGTPVRQFQRYVQDALKGDEILYKAWRLYGQYRRNESYWSFTVIMSQLLIIGLGTSATFFSTTQTFLLLYWRSKGLNFASGWDRGVVKADDRYLYLLFTTLQWLIIFLPISLTLVLSAYQGLHPWEKWVALRVAANNLCREIYMYRTRTLGYSQRAVKAQARKRDEEKGLLPKSGQSSWDEPKRAPPPIDEDLGSDQHRSVGAYLSREELLGLMMVKIQATLAASEAKSIPMGPLDDAIPPEHISDTGDTGLNDITPDDYVKFRLASAKHEYVVRSAAFDKTLHFTLSTGYLWGALGTALAALAAYGLTYLQAWVSLTTALVNAFNRYLDISRVQTLTELNNRAVHRLSDIEGWWSALGTGADGDKNKARLVRDTEAAIDEELEGWMRSLQNDEEELLKASEDARRAREEQESLRQGKMLDEVNRMRDLGLDALTPEAVASALSDPNGPAAKALRKQLLSVNDKLEGAIKPVERVVLGIVGADEIASTAATATAMAGAVSAAFDAATTAEQQIQQQTGRIATASEAVFASLHGKTKTGLHVAAVLMDPKVHAHVFRLFSDALEVRNISIHTLLWAIESHSAAAAEACEVAFPTPDKALAFLKAIVMQNLLREVQEGLGVSVPPHLQEAFVSGVSQWVSGESVPFGTLCQLLRDPAVKRWCMMLPKHIAAELVPVCRRRLTQANPSFQLLVAITRAMAEYQVMGALLDPSLAGHFTGESLLKVRSISSQMQTLTKDEIADVLPAPIRALCGSDANSSRLLVVCFAEQLLSGSLASRALDRVRPALGPAPIFDDRAVAEQVVAASMTELNQVQINTMSKGELLRALRSGSTRVHESTIARVSADLEEEALRDAMSVLQAAASTCYSCAIVDRVADYFSLLDLRKLLSSGEKEIIVKIISTIPPAVNVAEFTKEQLLAIVPFASVRSVLQAIDCRQLQDLIWMLRDATVNPYYIEVWERVRAVHLTPTKTAIVERMDTNAVNRLVNAVANLTSEDAERIEIASTVDRVLAVLGDEALSQALVGICTDAKKQSTFASTLAEIVDEIRGATKDVSMDVAWARFCRLWGRDSAGPRSLALWEGIQPVLDFFLKPQILQIASKGLTEVFGLTETDARAMLNVADEAMGPAEAALLAMREAGYLIASPHGVFREPGFDDPAAGAAAGAVAHIPFLAPLVRSLMWTLATDLPYNIFIDIAQRIPQFDLRDVVPCAAHRHRLSFLLALLVLDTETTAFFRAPDECLDTIDFVCTTAQLPLRRRDAYAKLERVLEARPFIDLAPNVRTMTPPQLRRLMQVATFVLTRTGAGSVFCALCDSFCAQQPPEMPLAIAVTTSTEFLICDVAFRLQGLMRSGAGEVRSLFADFDAMAFASIRRHEKHARLLRVLPDESLATEVSSLDIDALRLLFSVLSHTDDAKATLQETVRRSSEAALQKLRQVSAADNMFGNTQALFDDHPLDMSFGKVDVSELGTVAVSTAEAAFDAHGERAAMALAARAV